MSTGLDKIAAGEHEKDAGGSTVAPGSGSRAGFALTDPTYPVITDPEQAGAAEHFGVLRTRVLNAHSRTGARTILVTSAQKSEGKSLISTNLAISLAQLEKYRVLLTDGDLRVRGISRLLDLENQPGVSDFLEGSASFQSVLHSSPISWLSLAPAGTLPSDSAAEMLGGARWPEFLELAKREFDLVIVDSVPVIAPIADFELLAEPCDGMLLVVHLRKTDRESLDRTVQQMNGKLMGVVINNAEIRRGYDEYTYYRYRSKGK
jgi:capsular exopolysaccharide synthesis family protein